MLLLLFSRGLFILTTIHFLRLLFEINISPGILYLDNGFTNSLKGVSFEEMIKGHGHYFLQQDNPQLINYIRQKLHPPSKKPYNLAHPNRKNPTQFGQPSVIRRILGEK
ncbi:unnamed protein product, partial [Meganyctiphanes norvegica]